MANACAMFDRHLYRNDIIVNGLARQLIPASKEEKFDFSLSLGPFDSSHEGLLLRHGEVIPLSTKELELLVVLVSSRDVCWGASVVEPRSLYVIGQFACVLHEVCRRVFSAALIIGTTHFDSYGFLKARLGSRGVIVRGFEEATLNFCNIVWIG
jgi:hypothetical protein